MQEERPHTEACSLDTGHHAVAGAAVHQGRAAHSHACRPPTCGSHRGEPASRLSSCCSAADCQPCSETHSIKHVFSEWRLACSLQRALRPRARHNTHSSLSCSGLPDLSSQGAQGGLSVRQLRSEGRRRHHRPSCCSPLQTNAGHCASKLTHHSSHTLAWFRLQELSQLQDRVPAFPPVLARKIIEQQLGTRVEEAFAEFSMKPLAAASLGQVSLYIVVWQRGLELTRKGVQHTPASVCRNSVRSPCCCLLASHLYLKLLVHPSACCVVRWQECLA